MKPAKIHAVEAHGWKEISADTEKKIKATIKRYLQKFLRERSKKL